ncbi:MAG: hypothetical protein FJZ58_03840 [Chlamydiae bacterium]|nr:hypothetical protein [Chlamydiota bacterium]
MTYTITLSQQEHKTGILHPNTTLMAKHFFSVHGFLKIENLFSREWIASLAEAYASGLTYDKENYSLTPGTKTSHGRYIVSIPLHPPFDDPHLYANSILISLMKELLGSHILLTSLGAISALPGCMDQHLHADFYSLFEEEPKLSSHLPPFAITMAIPLLDIDPINGPTIIWSGSHLTYPVDQKMESYSKHLLYGPMGSCYFWDYRTFHAGGSNHSDHIRSLLYLSYTRRWFQDLSNPDRLHISEEIYKKIPSEHTYLFLKSHRKFLDR